MHKIKEYINEQIDQLLFYVTKVGGIDEKHKAYYNGQLLAYKDVLNQIEMQDTNYYKENNDG